MEVVESFKGTVKITGWPVDHKKVEKKKETNRKEPENLTLETKTIQ